MRGRTRANGLRRAAMTAAAAAALCLPAGWAQSHKQSTPPPQHSQSQQHAAPAQHAQSHPESPARSQPRTYTPPPNAQPRPSNVQPRPANVPPQTYTPARSLPPNQYNQPQPANPGQHYFAPQPGRPAYPGYRAPVDGAAGPSAVVARPAPQCAGGEQGADAAQRSIFQAASAGRAAAAGAAVAACGPDERPAAAAAAGARGEPGEAFAGGTAEGEPLSAGVEDAAGQPADGDAECVPRSAFSAAGSAKHRSELGAVPGTVFAAGAGDSERHAEGGAVRGAAEVKGRD